MRFRLSPRAADDLIAIYVEGVTLFGIQQAERHQDKLEAGFLHLIHYPEAGRLRTNLNPPMRVWPVKPHVIIYDVSGDVVNIRRVRHGREDWISSTL